MPTAFTHAAAGITSAYILADRRDRVILWIYVVFLSLMADFDVIAFHFGIPYAHTFGHRGFFHSLLFAVIVSFILSMVYYCNKSKISFGYLRVLLVFIIVSALHPLLDMFTSGGLGIGLFIPFNNERLFFPERPIKVSPIGLHSFFSGRGITVLKSELRIVILPSVALFFSAFLLRRIFIRRTD